MSDTNEDWLWDQAEDTATLSTKQVIEQGLPVLVVTHFADDHSWAFTCGVTDNQDDAMVVAMKTVIDLDPTLSQVIDLEPGWSAYRNAIGDLWTFEEDDDEDEDQSVESI